LRRTDKEITDPGIISDILANSWICRLGLVEYGEAYIVPVNFAFKDGCIFIHSAIEGRKMEIIKRNGSVTFEIEYSSETIKNETACKWGTKYRSVMGKGTVEIYHDAETKVECFDLLMRKYGAEFQPTYDESSLEKTVVLKLKILSYTGKQSGVW
jgi:nitroimidazol reductase NimA-like FMN-containing flavoprotein (pyridoxamine 5'-phosphate oxidase superfamily)